LAGYEAIKNRDFGRNRREEGLLRAQRCRRRCRDVVTGHSRRQKEHNIVTGDCAASAHRESWDHSLSTDFTGKDGPTSRAQLNLRKCESEHGATSIGQGTLGAISVTLERMPSITTPLAALAKRFCVVAIYRDNVRSTAALDQGQQCPQSHLDILEALHRTTQMKLASDIEAIDRGRASHGGAVGKRSRYRHSCTRLCDNRVGEGVREVKRSRQERKRCGNVVRQRTNSLWRDVHILVTVFAASATVFALGRRPHPL
jgi:hypothetical protein